MSFYIGWINLPVFLFFLVCSLNENFDSFPVIFLNKLVNLDELSLILCCERGQEKLTKGKTAFLKSYLNVKNKNSTTYMNTIKID